MLSLTLGRRATRSMLLALATMLSWAPASRAQGTSGTANDAGPSPAVRACLDATEQGQKLRDAGAYRRARERFIACAEEQCPGEVRKSCVGWLEELDKLMPTVVFAATARGADVTDVRVAVDGEPVADRIDGKPVAVDPGEHRFRFERSGEAAVEQTVVIRAGEKERVLAVRFGPEPAPAAPLQATPPPPQAASPSPAFYAVTVAAVASLLAGAALDVSGYVFLQQCTSDSNCSGTHERAEVQWRFITGDVLLGAGVACGVAAWFLRPRETRSASAARPAPLVGVAPDPHGATLHVKFSF
jgi:hypothetical protein